MVVWFATGNAHKKEELAAIFAEAILADAVSDGTGGGFDFRIPADAGLEFDPEETGADFGENALLKARELYSLLNRQGAWHQGARHRGDCIIADDSGLCVDALNGRPGILSARYAGPQNLAETNPTPHSPFPTPCGNTKKLDASQRNLLLLNELGNNPVRTARFVCAMTLLYTHDRFFTVQETFEGEIVKGPEFAKGTGGFGYDPIFFVPEFGRTAAELSEKEKNTVSHRAKAGKIIAMILKSFSYIYNRNYVDSQEE